MKVHPASITPFLFISKDDPVGKTSEVERMLIRWGEKMQKHLIRDRAKNFS